MSGELGTSVMSLEEARALLAQQSAELLRKEAARQVYVSRKFNRTFIITAVGTTRVKVQALGGCAC